MDSPIRNKWKAFKVSVYLLGAFGLFLVGFMAWTAITEFTNPSVEDALGISAIVAGGLLIIAFQLLHIQMLRLQATGHLLSRAMLNGHVVLYIVNVLLFASVVVGLAYLIQGIVRNWNNLYINTWNKFFYSGWLLLTLCFLYNLIVSVLFRQQLVRESNSAHELMLDLFGQPEPEGDN